MVQPNGTSWDKLEYVGQVGQGEGGLQILVGQVGQGEGGLQIFVGQVGQGQGVYPLEPFHLSQMGLQGREIFAHNILICGGIPKKRIEFQQGAALPNYSEDSRDLVLKFQFTNYSPWQRPRAIGVGGVGW